MKNVRCVSRLVVAVLMLSGSICGRDQPQDGWRKTLMLAVSTTQSSYSDSWTGGEAGSVNWVADMNGSAEKQLRDWLDFKSTLRLSLGQTLTQDAEDKKWSKPKKSTDKIDWENVLRFTLSQHVDPYVALRLESQFFDGSVEAKKRFFSPLLLTESAGIARTFYAGEDECVTSRLGFGLRQLIKTVIVGDTGKLDTEDSVLTDGGIESVTDAAFSLHKNIRYVGKLTLYRALFFSESDEVKGTPAEDDWKAIDVNWENTISAAITKIISVNLYSQLLYDRETSRKGRLKETLAVGLTLRML